MGKRSTGLSVWWVMFLLSGGISFAANRSDFRLVKAAEKGDKEAVRSLLKQHADANTRGADGATALAWAAYRDDLETAAMLIGAGANVNAANDLGVGPLSLACTNGNAAMVEILLKAGANPNAAMPTGETALMTAARSGNADTVKLLLAQGADVNAKENRQGQTALMWAIAENHTPVAKALIENGADIRAHSNGGFTPFLFAAQQGSFDSARILLAAGADVNETSVQYGSALVVATGSGHEEFALFLLDKGADPNAANRYGVTALHYSILKGLAHAAVARYDPNSSYLYRPNMLALVKALLARGANPNARIVRVPPLPGNKYAYGRVTVVGATPYILAAASYDANLMRVLAAAGANPRLTTKEGSTALIFAAGLADGYNYLPIRTEQLEKDALEAAKVAVDLGNDVNTANKSGETPLHGAAYVGADAIVQFLVDKGANVNVTDDSGQTPLTIANDENPPKLLIFELKPQAAHLNTAALLLKLGATPMTAK